VQIANLESYIRPNNPAIVEKAIVPVDTMSASNAYGEQYVAIHFTSAPSVAGGTTLTRVSMVKY
jgi:hypothetical protein